jgi:hypothetical protein
VAIRLLAFHFAIFLILGLFFGFSWLTLVELFSFTLGVVFIFDALQQSWLVSKTNFHLLCVIA